MDNMKGEDMQQIVWLWLWPFTKPNDQNESYSRVEKYFSLARSMACEHFTSSGEKEEIEH